MTILVQIVLYGWLAVALALFATLPPRRAMLYGLIGAWLFLPIARDVFPILHYSKINAVGLGLLMAVLIFDTARLLAFRPGWFDVPAMLLCLSPAISTLANGQDYSYAGVSTVNHFLTYGVPYLMGRIYIRDLSDMWELAIALLIGGLVYLPLCLYEVRMSPQLHAMVYGFHQHDWSQTKRDGGFRPTVFMEHGLAVAMWICATSLVGLGLWHLGRMRSLYIRCKLPMWLLVCSLIVTAWLCKSSGAWLLLIVGGLMLLVGRAGGLRWMLVALALFAPCYMVLRGSGRLTADTVCNAAAHVANEERIASLRTRLIQEDALVGRALVHPVYGWGPWGENRINDAGLELVTITDGLWVILFGKFGLIGVVSYTLLLLLPVLMLVQRYNRQSWADPAFAPAAVLSLVLIVFMIDCLGNAMANPVFIVVAGALANLATRTEPILAARTTLPRSSTVLAATDPFTVRPAMTQA